MTKMTMKVPEMSCKFFVARTPELDLHAGTACPVAGEDCARARAMMRAFSVRPCLPPPPPLYAWLHTRMFTGGHCKGAIEKEVSKLDGVTNVLADPASKDVVVDFDVPATWDLIKETLIKHEFPPQEEKVLEGTTAFTQAA